MNILGINLRKILHNDNSLVHVDYLRYQSISEIYNQATGPCLLLKDQLSEEEIAWLSFYPHDVDIFTMPARSYCASEYIDKLVDVGRHIHYVKSIELNLFHFGQTLFVFHKCKPEDGYATGPNVIKIDPVKRTEIVTLIVAVEQSEEERNQSTVEDASESIEVTEQASDSETGMPANDLSGETSEEAAKRLLLLQELKTRFDQNFSFVKVHFKGGRIERLSIPLSEFYEMHHISGGRLKGSWTLFEKNEIEKWMDKGILQRAVNVVSEKYTLRISQYGQIVRVQDRKQFIAAIKQIEHDFREYLAGKKQGGAIGDIRIEKAFNVSTAKETGFSLLEEYLNGVMPSSCDPEVYGKETQAFVEAQRAKCEDFSNRVELKTEETAYRESQWEDPDFIHAILKSFEERARKDTDFAREQRKFVELLEKYEVSLNGISLG